MGPPRCHRHRRHHRVASSTIAVVASILLAWRLPRRAVAVDIEIPLMTRDAVAEQMDTYTYTFAAMPAGQHYIKWFEPKADMARVHHMLLFGCEGAVSPHLHTRSGGMFSANGGEPRGAVCADSSSEPFIFGWGKNAPPLHLPDHVGFRVGEGGFKNIVLEVHYLEAQDKEAVTESGLVIHVAPGIPRRAMSVLSFAQGFVLPARTPEVKVPNTCCYTMARPLTAFAFRVHTHALGREVYLERLVAGQLQGTDDPRGRGIVNAPVRLMGRDPQLAQLFERLNETIVIRPGDKLRVTCVFDTTSREKSTPAGWGHGDEMCNLYLMVHAEEPSYMACSGQDDGNSRLWLQHSPDNGHPEANHPDPSRLAVYLVPPPPPGGRGASGVEGHPAARWSTAIGQVGGLAAEEDGRHVWVFHRGSRTWTGESFSTGHRVLYDEPIAENTIVRVCTTTGRIVKAFGAGEHYMPHGLSLGPDGSVWITDVGLHQVIRYDQDTGERIAAYGVEKEPGRDGEGFCMPTQVAVAEDGSFWVADGYCNARVARFNADGDYVGQWGAANRRNAFEVPHSIALDSRSGRLVVADRENSRVAIHSVDGTMEREFDLSEHGFVYGVSVLRSEEQGMSGFYAVCWSRVPGRPVRLVVHWTKGNVGLLHWDLPTVEVPHMIAVFGGAVGGTKNWGRGVSVFVGETRPRVGDVSVQRLWLGESFGAQYEIVPARGWMFRSDQYLNVPPVGEALGLPPPTEEEATPRAPPEAPSGAEQAEEGPDRGTTPDQAGVPSFLEEVGARDAAEAEAATKNAYEAVKQDWAETARASAAHGTHENLESVGFGGMKVSPVAGWTMIVLGSLMLCCLCCVAKPGSKAAESMGEFVEDVVKTALPGGMASVWTVLRHSDKREYRRMQQEKEIEML